jgi:cell division septal protein FtsQ
MSDFFESDNSASAVSNLEREMRREERRHGERRKLTAAVLAVAVACVVLLGGGFGAYAAARRPATKAVAVAPAKHVKHPTPKHKRK